MLWRLMIGLGWLISLTACTSGPSAYVIPDSRQLIPVWDEHGQPLHGWAGISAGYLRELLLDLERCAGATPTSLPDPHRCVISGYLYQMPSEPVGLARTDQCLAIRHRVEDGRVLLWSVDQWVTIPLPPEMRGHVRFIYRWGADVAHLDARVVSIERGAAH